MKRRYIDVTERLKTISLTVGEAEIAADAMSAAESEFGSWPDQTEVHEKLAEFVKANKK